MPLILHAAGSSGTLTASAVAILTDLDDGRNEHHDTIPHAAGGSGGDEQEGPHHSHGKQRGGYRTAKGVRREEDGQGVGQGESAF